MKTMCPTLFASFKTLAKQVSLILAGIFISAAVPAAVVVEAPGATVAGKTIGEWTAAWWQWAVALAPPGDPFTDTTGEFANANPSGPVFFLAGSPGGSRSRNFTVPANTYLLVPLLAGEWSQLELGFDKTAAYIRQAAQQQADQFDSLHATLDGVAIPQTTLFTHRESSPDFNFVAVASNSVNVPAGNSGIAVADGYFLMIAPLTPGTHVLNYGGGASASGINLDETDTITAVVPVTRYVNVNSATATPPYTNWSTAAVTIQQAVDAAVAGDQILVTNGVYQTGGRTAALAGGTNRVAVTKAVAVQSVNGFALTTIRGFRVPGTTNGPAAIRCAYLVNGASLSGFTLINGATSSGESGGGVWCQSTASVISNCFLVRNAAASDGGGAFGGTLNYCAINGNSSFARGGGIAGGTLNFCTLTGNLAPEGAGAYRGTLNNCTLTGHSAYFGGGTYDSTLNNCMLTGNSGTWGGGAYQSTLNNCTLTGNSAYSGGGMSGGTLNNCRLTSNSANYGGGAANATLHNCELTSNSADYGGGMFESWSRNCTLSGNSAASFGGGAYGTDMDNCIVYFNTGAGNYDYSMLNYCCTMPMPTNGVGNITNAPLFTDQAGGNLRLQSNSPCLNAGSNASAVGGTDLDGRTRVEGGKVDIGAYEFHPGVSGEFLGWLSQYGLPTNGSADYADSDSDRLNNWQEWRADTNPTNAASVLRLFAPTGSVGDVTVRWQSVATRSYFLERSLDLGSQSAFLPLQTNIPGLAGETSFTDTNASSSGPFFYRVGLH